MPLLHLAGKCKTSPMKLPRWIVVGMLVVSVLGVLAVPLWCWLEWPRLTARRFVQLISEGRFDEAHSMMQAQDMGSVFLYYAQQDPPDVLRVKYSVNKIEFDPRSASDMLAGRLKFRIKENYPMNVELGIVSDQVEAVFWSMIPIVR